MTGREKFNKNRKIIFFMYKIAKYFPKGFKLFLWNSFQNSNRKYSILIRYILLKALCKSIGNNVFIGSGVEIVEFKNLTIGENVSIHKNCYIDATGGVKIGNNVSIAHFTSVISSNHTWNDENKPIKYNKAKCKVIAIDDDVWIGAGCRILAGTTIEKRSIVAAGAVVTKTVSSKTIVGGIPAKVIKSI